MTADQNSQLKAVFDRIVAHTPALGPTPTPQLGADSELPRARPWLTAAAATIAVAGLGGVAFLAWPDTQAPSSDPAPPPTIPAPADTDTDLAPSTPPATSAETAAGQPTLYPVLDDIPTGLSVAAFTQPTPSGPRWTEALVGRPIDGVVSDPIVITVQSEPFEISPQAGHPPEQVTVLDETATLFDYGTTGMRLTWGDGPYFLASGTDPVAFLDRTTAETFQVADATSPDAPPELSFGPLPDGFDVIAPPTAVGTPAVAATLSIGDDNYDINVSTRNPLVNMAMSGPLISVDIGGQPGWTFLSSLSTQDITWQVDDTTYAYLKVNDGSDADSALALATSITFTDWTTWVARYNPTIGNTSTTTLESPSTDNAATE